MCISNTNVAIKFSAEPSSGMLKVQSFVSQIIQKLLGAWKPKGLNRITNIG
jgi:hypothetical protein